jgi:alpha/beta superfamily hydrolase
VRAPWRLDLLIDGPAGPLEAVIETPVNFSGELVAVLCHPHPLFGGTLTNKVIHTIARAFQELGAETVRFNFRGVGKSAGTHDNGVGEVGDALAAVAAARIRHPGGALWLGGFSFGAMIAFECAQRANPAWLVTVAPAEQRFPAARTLPRPRCPWLIVQGDADDLVNAREVSHWAGSFEPPPVLRILPGGEHFFHGRLNELHAAIVEERP